MRLIDLVTFFRQGGTLCDLCLSKGLRADSEVIEIYSQGLMCMEAELGFFPIEESKGRIEFEFQRLNYHYLFDVFYFLQVIDDEKGLEGRTDDELAKQLYSYAINDC